MALKGLIFDFDGVIIDSETPEYLTWKHIFAQYGVNLTLQIWETGLGTSASAFNPLDFLESSLNHPVDREKLRNQHRSTCLEMISHMPILPGIQKFISQALELGIHTAIASSSNCEWISSNLHRLGLSEQIQVTCTGDEVSTVKPSPELYLLALSRMGIKPQEAIAIEDSPNGIRAAKAARIFCIAIPNPVSKDLDLSSANLIAPSLADLHLQDLITQFQTEEMTGSVK
jgi:HAD superfamily hydrolase (TIGR01509 family)